MPQRTNIPRPMKKDPKDTLERAFNKLAWGFFSGRREYHLVGRQTIHLYIVYVHEHISSTIPSTPEWSYLDTHTRTHTTKIKESRIDILYRRVLILHFLRYGDREIGRSANQMGGTDQLGGTH